MDYKMLNGADLAYIGDAIYELKIRTYLINKNITKTKDLNKLAVNFVSAKAHSFIYESLKDDLTVEEQSIFLRGRNKAPSGHRKNIDRSDYLKSSGLEAVFGYLYLKEDLARLDELINKSIDIVEKSLC